MGERGKKTLRVSGVEKKKKRRRRRKSNKKKVNKQISASSIKGVGGVICKFSNLLLYYIYSKQIDSR